MSDDLVKRWDDHVESLCSPMSTIEHMAQKMRNRIEALTAERDRLGRELNVAKYGQPDFAWSVHLAAMAEVQAERDRLREALQQFLIEYDEVDLANAEPSSLTAAVLSARAALKGETP